MIENWKIISNALTSESSFSIRTNEDWEFIWVVFVTILSSNIWGRYLKQESFSDSSSKSLDSHAHLCFTGTRICSPQVNSRRRALRFGAEPGTRSAKNAIGNGVVENVLFDICH